MSNKTVVVGCPAASIPPRRRCSWKRQGLEVVGLFGEELGRRRYGGVLFFAPGPIDVMRLVDRIGIDVEVVNFCRRASGAVFAEFLREYQGRPDAEPGHPVQLGNRSLPRPCAEAGRRQDRHRPLRWRARVQRQIPVAQSRGRDQGPELFSLPPEPEQLAKSIFPWPTSTSARCERLRTRRGCRWRPRRTPPGSAFIGERPFKDSSCATCPRGGDPSPGRRRKRCLGSTMASCTHAGQREGLAGTSGRQEQGQAGGGDHEAWFVAGDMREHPHVVQGHDHPALPGYPGGRATSGSGQAPHTHWSIN